MGILFDFDKDYGTVVGTDEAGRGPAAGGVFASAVYFPDKTDKLISDLAKLNDSKKLSKISRENLYDIIIQNSINSVVCIEVEEIEKINILNSSLKAMKLACENVIKEAKLEFPTKIYNKMRREICYNCGSKYSCKSYSGQVYGKFSQRISTILLGKKCRISYKRTP